MEVYGAEPYTGEIQIGFWVLGRDGNWRKWDKKSIWAKGRVRVYRAKSGARKDWVGIDERVKTII